MTDMTPHRGIGDNAPPPFDPAEAEKHAPLVAEKIDAAGAWLDLKKLTSEDEARQLNDYVEGCKQLAKVIDTERKAAKKPFDDAGKAVQAAYNPLLDRLTRARDRVIPMLTAWEVAKRKAAEKAEREAHEKAERERQEAEKAGAEARARNDLSGEAEAEEKARAADATIKEVAKTARAGFGIESASGGGRKLALRSTRQAKVRNAVLALADLRDNHPEAFAAAASEIERVCTRLVQAKGGENISIKGVEIDVIRKVA